MTNWFYITTVDRLINANHTSFLFLFVVLEDFMVTLYYCPFSPLSWLWLSSFIVVMIITLQFILLSCIYHLSIFVALTPKLYLGDRMDE